MLLCPHCGRPHVGLGLPSDVMTEAYEQGETETVNTAPILSMLTLATAGAALVGGAAGYGITRYAVGAKSTGARVAGTAIGGVVAGGATFAAMAISFAPGRY